MPVQETDWRHVYAEVTLRPLAGSKARWAVQMPVGTGATDTFVPAGELRRLGKGVADMSSGVVRNEEALRLEVLGFEHIVRLRGADSGGRVVLVELNIPPGRAIPPHVHTREDEAFHVLAGRIDFTLAGRPVVATAGTTLFAPRGVAHGVAVAERHKPAHALVIIFPAGIEEMFVELSRLPPGPPDLARVAEICGRYGITFV